MLRFRFLALTSIVTLAAAAAHAQGGAAGALSEISTPGGLTAALAATGDRAAPDRSQFLLEFVRRTYDSPIILKHDPRALALQQLLAEMRGDARPVAAADSTPARRANADARRPPAATAAADTLPLPLTTSLWIDVVFGGRATPQALVPAILESRGASLFYYGLMSLDEETRAWLAGRPQLIQQLASRYAAPFLAAAPGLRVHDGAMHLPGGAAAEPGWEALVGDSTHDAARFAGALFGSHDSMLAGFVGAMAQLTPAQVEFAMHLGAPDPAARAAAARRLYDVFARVAWRPEQHAFSRPSMDPATLVSALAADEQGTPILPGTGPFWTAVFDGGPGGGGADASALARGDGVDVTWLCEQIFKGDSAEQRRRYNRVLFASRKVRRITAETVRDALVAVRAAGPYPALVAALERARLDDIHPFAAAAGRAAQLSSIGDRAREVRAHAQFQGALALVTGAASRGALAPAALATAVTSLSAIDPDQHGDYDGRLVRWLAAFVDEYTGDLSGRPSGSGASSPDASDKAAVERITGDMDRAALRIAADPAPASARFVDWEGTRYRVDFASARITRVARLLGDDHPPYLTAARDLVRIADALAAARLTSDMPGRQLDALEAVGRSMHWDGDRALPARSPDAYRRAAGELRRMSHEHRARRLSRLAPPLRTLADDLLARGLMHLVYAAAMGQPDRAPITVAEAASRHDFRGSADEIGHTGPWQRPVPGTRSVPGRGWYIAGSVLGLDVTLAEFSLIRLSSRPPSRPPTMSEEDRRVMTQALALTEPARLVDAARDAIVEAVRRGRGRLAAIRTVADARAIADDVGLSPARRSLLPWIVAHDPGRLTAFLSPVELLWLGLGRRSPDGTLQAWGAPAEPRLGCLCVQLLDRRPWESLAGRWHAGLLASAFPDLNLRLAELLADLKMPASLLGAVLAAATIDFTENATSRDPDDRRGPVEFVQALGSERVEQYLALLTTDGPLVPTGDAPEPEPSPAKRAGAPR